jgi:hypothetical protein
MAQEQERRYVFLLWHSTPLDDHPTSPDTDDKLLGVFDTEALAEAVKNDVLDQPGFRDWPHCFEISRCEINKPEWTEGFITWEEASRDLP